MSEEFEDNNDLINEGTIKLSQFIQSNQIKIENFWKLQQIAVSQGEFKSFLIGINFPDVERYFQQIALSMQDYKKNITLEKVCKKINLWNHSEDFMIDYIKQKALRIVQSAKQRQRPQSGFHGAQNRPISGISVQTKVSAFSDLKSLQNINEQSETNEKMPNINKSKVYLKSHSKKQKEIDKLLQITIKKGNYEYEYESLIKMGEANEICMKIQTQITYRGYKSADGSMKVHVYEGEKYLRELNLDEFQREYNQVKTHYDSELKLKKQDKEKKTDLSMHKQMNKKDRQQELKQVLLETMMLTNVLKQQLSVLNKKGIAPNNSQQN